MISSYYERSNIVHLDGTNVFQTAEDRNNERTTAALIEKAWGCKLISFGALSPVDWHAERFGRTVGILELKSAHRSKDQYPHAILNVRKWFALMLGTLGLDVPAIFVVRFNDAVLWVPVKKIDARKMRLGGCSRRVKNDNDIEPVILVPIAEMHQLEDSKGQVNGRIGQN